MGGTFRFMTHFAGALAFLCAGAYKGAQVYAFKHRPPLLKLYVFYLKRPHCAQNTYPCLKLQYMCPAIIILLWGVLGCLNVASLRMTVGSRRSSCSHAMDSTLQANIFVTYSMFCTRSKAGPVYVKSNFSFVTFTKPMRDSAKQM